VEISEQDVYGVMLYELRRIGLWAQRLDGDGSGFQVRPGSELHADDLVLGDYALSHAAWSALAHAVDHLHMLRTGVDNGATAHPFAPYTLLRAAIENAATAVWLLTPDVQKERVTRRLRKAAADINMSEQIKKLIEQPGPRTRRERIADLRAIAAAQGIESGVALERIGFGEIVQLAGAEVECGAVLAQVMWHAGSGIAHGDQWATLTVPDRAPIPGSPLGVTNLRLTAGMNPLATMVLIATDLTVKGWDLFDQRRKR
jgi:hypothetical protein